MFSYTTILMSKHAIRYGLVHKTNIWHDKSQNMWHVVDIRKVLRVISGFLREVGENRALLGCYAANSGNFLPTFRDNLSVPS